MHPILPTQPPLVPTQDHTHQTPQGLGCTGQSRPTPHIHSPHLLQATVILSPQEVVYLPYHRPITPIRRVLDLKNLDQGIGSLQTLKFVSIWITRWVVLLVGLLTGRFTRRSVGWLVGLMVGRFAAWSVSWRIRVGLSVGLFNAVWDGRYVDKAMVGPYLPLF